MLKKRQVTIGKQAPTDLIILVEQVFSDCVFRNTKFNATQSYLHRMLL
jgi:hypothetical protein